MKFKVFVCTVLFIAALCSNVHAGSLCSRYYCPGYDSSPVETSEMQKTTNNTYNDILVTNRYGNYLHAYCLLKAFTGSKYTAVSAKIRCTKGVTRRISKVNDYSNWGVNTYMKLNAWSGDATEMDYNEIDWNFY